MEVGESKRYFYIRYRATPLKSETKYYLNGNIPWLTSGALNKNLIEDSDEYITKESYDKTNLRLYPPNTLLLAMYGEGKTRGKCSELKIKATTNQAIAAIVMNRTANKLKKYLKLFSKKLLFFGKRLREVLAKFKSRYHKKYPCTVM